MTKYQLIYPMAFYVFYIFALGVYMFRSRVNLLKKREVAVDYFKTYSGDGPQGRALVVSRHYDNQFQLPLLFLITCAVHMGLDQAGYFTLILAWLFVAARLVHSWIHLGGNHVPRRAMAFGAGWLVLLVMWGELFFRTLVAPL